MTRLVVLLAALLVVPGCTQPHQTVNTTSTTQAVAVRVSQPSLLPERYLSATLAEANFTTSDGTFIHATAYLPSLPRSGFEQAAKFHPLVNMATFYDSGSDTQDWMRLVELRGGLNKTYVFGNLVSHGFAYVAASLPGTGHSGGCTDLGGPKDGEHISEFIEYMAAQPWSTGNVGMTGGGDAGTTQYLAATQNVPHLKAIVPHLASFDLYTDYYQDGAPRSYWGAYGILKDELGQFGVDYNVDLSGFNTTHPAPPSVPEISPRLCAGTAEHIQKAATTYATGVRDAFWQDRDYTSRLGDIRVSVFIVASTVAPFQSLAWEQIRAPKLLWLQDMPPAVPSSAGRLDYDKALVAFYDHVLNGTPNRILEVLPRVQVQDQTGYWHNYTQWPPKATNATLYLGAGTLELDEPASGQVVIVTPPWLYTPQPRITPPEVPELRPLPPLPPVDPWPESPTENASSAPELIVAHFVGEELQTPLLISGLAHLDLTLSVDRTGYSHLVAGLYRFHNDTLQRLTLGARGLAQRNGVERDEPPTPDQGMAVPIEFAPCNAVLEPGDRLVLTLSGDGPGYQPNGNYPTFTIQYGGTLTLPVMPPERGLNSTQMMAADPYYTVSP